MKKLIPLFCLAAISVGCSNTQAPVDKATVQAEIDQRWTGFINAWEAEDAKACAEFYTENSINVPPGGEIKKGKKSIQDFYQFLFDNNLSSKYEHKSLDLNVAGNLATELGEFKVDWTSNDSTEWTFRARSMCLWKKSDTGNWEMDQFVFNNPPNENQE